MEESGAATENCLHGVYNDDPSREDGDDDIVYDGEVVKSFVYQFRHDFIFRRKFIQTLTVTWTFLTMASVFVLIINILMKQPLYDWIVFDWCLTPHLAS